MRCSLLQGRCRCCHLFGHRGARALANDTTTTTASFNAPATANPPKDKRLLTDKMPASTRSATKQAKLEDVGAGADDDVKSKAKSSKPASKAAATAKKRKADDSRTEADIKGAKQAKKTPDNDEADDSDVIIINRAPVLELWASCVAHTLHPSLPWETCLSVGGAISTIGAISKGRSIGTIDKPDPGEAQEKREKRKEKADEQGLEELEVMSFHLRIKDGQAMVGDKPKKAGEEALRKKFGGEEQYEKVRKAFEGPLEGWKTREEELDKRAFGMYEDFRPNVKPGQAGWGRKGELRLGTVRSVVGET